MQDTDSYRQFLRQRHDDEQLIARFNRQLEDYVRDHPDAEEAEVRAYVDLLLAAIPGLPESVGRDALAHQITLAMVADRGDGVPVSGPSATWEDDERTWKIPELWTVDDYRVTLAWYREPGAPAAQLAALIAYGETRWPGEDLARQPWPDTSDLPDWADLAPSLNREIDPEDEDKDDA